MKLIFSIILILLLLPSLQNISLDSQEEGEYMVSVKREPTREDILVASFRDEVPEVKELLRRESGMNPTAINQSSGACGLFQSLPCQKMGCELSHDIHDVRCQIKWGAKYIYQRYGSVANALAWHDEHNWY